MFRLAFFSDDGSVSPMITVSNAISQCNKVGKLVSWCWKSSPFSYGYCGFLLSSFSIKIIHVVASELPPTLLAINHLHFLVLNDIVKLSCKILKRLQLVYIFHTYFYTFPYVKTKVCSDMGYIAKHIASSSTCNGFKKAKPKFIFLSNKVYTRSCTSTYFHFAKKKKRDMFSS